MFSHLYLFQIPSPHPQTYEINEAACKMAKEVANEGGAVTCGGLCPVRYEGRNLEVVKEEFEKQLQPFIDNDIDFVLAEVSVSCITTGL